MSDNKKEDIDLLIIVPPAGVVNTIFLPYGAMYICSALRSNRCNSKILNIDTERLTNEEVIKRVKEINPRYIGFSVAVAHLYSYIKTLSNELKVALPDKLQILGGGISSSAEVILRNTGIDIVVCGEGDVTVVELIDSLKKGSDLKDVRGIYYKNSDSFVCTGKRKLIMNLDVLPYPAFDMIDINKYICDGPEFIHSLSNGAVSKKIYAHRADRNMMTIPTGRGCFNECSFCFREYPGLRVHSVKYIFDFIEYCMKNFNIGFFVLGDECFAPTKKHNWEFIEEYKRRKLDIIFKISGMRVDTVDREILHAFKEIGCWMIEYGFESGSQKMLNIINKRVTVAQNRDAAIWTREAGIFTVPALVLGMPGETTQTVHETIAFLKSLNLNFKQYQWKYAIPVPGSQLYDFAKITGAIEDDEEYLCSLVCAPSSIDFNVNLTDEPDEVVNSWKYLMKKELDDYYFRTRYKGFFTEKVMRFVKIIGVYYRRKSFLPAIVQKIRALLPFRSEKQKLSVQNNQPRFRKKTSINTEAVLKGIDCSVLNKYASLRNINARLSKDRLHDISV